MVRQQGGVAGTDHVAEVDSEVARLVDGEVAAERELGEPVQADAVGRAVTVLDIFMNRLGAGGLFLRRASLFRP